MEPFFADLGTAYGKAVRAFGEAGCTYLQLDEVYRRLSLRRRAAPDAARPRRRSRQAAARLCRPGQRRLRRPHARHDDLACISAAATSARPGWRRAATSAVADILFNQMNVDAYFMEYDTERAGGFEPLRFLPKGKHGRAGRHDLEDRRAGEQGPAQAPDRRGGEVRPARPALPVAAMRLRLAPRRATCWPRTSSGPSSPAASRSRARSGVSLAGARASGPLVILERARGSGKIRPPSSSRRSRA